MPKAITLDRTGLPVTGIQASYGKYGLVYAATVLIECMDKDFNKYHEEVNTVITQAEYDRLSSEVQEYHKRKNQ